LNQRRNIEESDGRSGWRKGHGGGRDTKKKKRSLQARNFERGRVGDCLGEAGRFKVGRSSLVGRANKNDPKNLMNHLQKKKSEYPAAKKIPTARGKVSR